MYIRIWLLYSSFSISCYSRPLPYVYIRNHTLARAPTLTHTAPTTLRILDFVPTTTTQHSLELSTSLSLSQQPGSCLSSTMLSSPLGKLPSITPSTPTPPSLDRRNSSPSRHQCPGSATSFLSKVVSYAQSKAFPAGSAPSSPSPSMSEDKVQWESMSRRNSDQQSSEYHPCTPFFNHVLIWLGYISFPDFDRTYAAHEHPAAT